MNDTTSGTVLQTKMFKRKKRKREENYLPQKQAWESAKGRMGRKLDLNLENEASLSISLSFY